MWTSIASRGCLRSLTASCLGASTGKASAAKLWRTCGTGGLRARGLASGLIELILSSCSMMIYRLILISRSLSYFTVAVNYLLR